MKSLKQKWGKFLCVVLSPGTVLFFLLTVISLITAFVYKENTLFATLLSILGSIFAGFGGGFIRDDYNQLITENVLEKKGRSAVRNLEAIREQITQLRGWIKSFRDHVGKEGKKALDETERHLSTIMFNTIAGVEDWVDVVPELKAEEERVATISEKQQEVLQAYVEELLANKKELVVSKDEGRVTELKKRITDLEEQIKDIRKHRASWSGGTMVNSSGVSLGSASLGSRPLGVGVGVTQTCSRCGRLFSSSQSGFSVSPLCSDCWLNGGGGVITADTFD